MFQKLALAAVLMSITRTASADFSYEHFTSPDGFAFVGNSALTQSSLRLTPSSESQVGAVWLEEKQLVTAGFDLTFSFVVTGPFNGFGPADGLAFVIQNKGLDAIGNNGGGLGYEGMSNSVAIELRHFDSRRMAVQTNGTQPNGIGGQFNVGGEATLRQIADGSVHTVTIHYEANQLNISFDGQLVLTPSIDLSTTLDLDSGKAWLGFTAGTGGAYATHKVLSWSFSSGPHHPFRRGDVDGDGALLITDPIRVLDSLFVGTATLNCLDAADSNDDGNVDVSDSVGVLNFLFLGGFAPPAPFVECGIDPPTDDLTCEQHGACE